MKALFVLCTLVVGLAFTAAPLAAQTSVVQTILSSPEDYTDRAAAVEAHVEELLARLTPDEKIKMLGGTGFTTQPIERLGIPAFQMSDASCGVRDQLPSPAYAASVCLAASWDAALAQKVGASIGRDARARGVHLLLGPEVNLYRAPMGDDVVQRLVWGSEEPMPADGEYGLRVVREANAAIVCAGFDRPGATWTDYGVFKEGEGWDRSYKLPAQTG